jgi:hypothetical protein
MNAAMIFSTDDFAKVMQDQNPKLIQLKKQARANSKTSTSFMSKKDLSCINCPNTYKSTTTKYNTNTFSPMTGNNVRQLHPNQTLSGTSLVVSTEQPPTQIFFAGKNYNLNGYNLSYNISSQTIPTSSSLVDGGAMEGMCGSDVRTLHQTQSIVNVTGIADNSVTNLPLYTVAGLSRNS